MAQCKSFGCEKTLVGKEKFICKSCKDKLKSDAKTGVKVILATAGMLLLAAAKSGVGSDDEKL